MLIDLRSYRSLQTTNMSVVYDIGSEYQGHFLLQIFFLNKETQSFLSSATQVTSKYYKSEFQLAKDGSYTNVKFNASSIKNLDLEFNEVNALWGTM